jgi:hypothetical protein
MFIIMDQQDGFPGEGNNFSSADVEEIRRLGTF